MHNRIRKFSQSGTLADDSYIWSERERYSKILDDLMRIKGYIPHLDLNIDWSHDLQSDGHYTFTITWWGVFVGRDVSLAKQPTGFSDGKLIIIK